MDARSDLYSVGIMLFQLLTGRIPFDADSPLAIAYAHVQEEPVAPSSINRSITPAMDALVARALKKNPNERFPSAAAMQDEITRVLNAGGPTGAPVIIGGGAPANSGSGVGSAVFPPVDQSTPAPQNVQMPYQPQQYQQQPGPYGPPTPTPAPSPSYGYPQANPAYGTPVPMQHQYRTPAPYDIAPQPVGGGGSGSGGRNKRNMPVIVGSIVVALIAIGGLITVLSLKDDPAGSDSGNGGDPSSSAVAGEHKDPERNRTMKTEDCTDAMEDSDDPNKVDAPSFLYKDIVSAKECALAAGWTIKTIEVAGNTYAEDQIIDQFPSAGTAIPEKGAHFELRISTGDPA